MEIDRVWQERFRRKWVANKATGCWEWIGAHVPKGYGIIKIPGTRRQEYSHRLSWMISFGEIPDGKHVLHVCDNPRCVNPEHLFLGDAKTNAWDMRAKKRHLYGEKNAKAILTSKDVLRIKSLIDFGISQKAISMLFGVSQITISRIKRGLRWPHIK